MSQPRISKRSQKVWARLVSWYGSRIAEAYGSEPPEDWAFLIDRNDDERLETALLAVRRLSPIHPPTLGQLESALPARTTAETPSLAFVLSEAALERFRDLCKHQIAKPWNYFGPIEDFVSKHRNNEIIRHPRIVGVQIPACAECGTYSRRLKLDEIAGAGV